MEWLAGNFASLLIFLGIILLVIEVGLLGFAVFLLFFIGLACIVTGALIMIDLVPGTLVAAFGSIALFSVLFALLLWKPLKRIQDNTEANSVKGDFIGHRFLLAQDISSQRYGSYRMSGIEWKVRSETPLAAGTEVAITRAEVGLLTVAAAAPEAV
jgi:membrane protein implicated in regulation of membrane protease activity